MKVFKFGGASVKDAEGVKNVGNILKMYPNDKLVVVVSAMGKITNALETLVRAKDETEAGKALAEIKKFHTNILQDLFPGKKNPVFDVVENELNNARRFLTDAKG